MDTLVKTAVRSAEADRVSSCKFADNVAQSSIDFFRVVCPENLAEAYKQTVIATIVVQTPIYSCIDSDVESGLKILSLGVGTKVLNGNVISVERKSNISNGDRLVRDCHAEILARRGFVAYLYSELERLSGDENYVINNPNCIFEWNQHNKLQLKSGYTLHLYTSSQPCGNASNKKWAKCKAPLQYPNLCAHQFPTEIHNKIQIISRHEGQVAVLVKKNNYKVTCDAQTNSKSEITDAVADINTRNIIQKEQNHSSPTALHYQCLPGTAPVNSGDGNVMTCSDKIALWNVLGLQGSLLSNCFSPLHLSTITVGRKFSKIHAERALCCRLQEYCFPVTEEEGNKSRRKNKKAKVNDETTATANKASDVTTGTAAATPTDPTMSHASEICVVSDVGSVAVVSSIPVPSSVQSNNELVKTSDRFRTVFRVNHPVMLSTKVKLDESAISTAISTTTSVATTVTTADNKDLNKMYSVANGASSAESTELAPFGTIEDTTTTENSINTLVVGAQFADWRSLCCWFHSNSSSSDSNSDGSSNDNTSNICNGRENVLSDHQLEVIDGRTGLLYQSPSCSTAGLETIASVDNSLISQLSSYSFGAKYKALRRKFNNSNNSSNKINIPAQQDSCENTNHRHNINCTPYAYRDMKATGCFCSCDVANEVQQNVAHNVEVEETGNDNSNCPVNSPAEQLNKTPTTAAIDVSSVDTCMIGVTANTYISEHTAAKEYLKSNDKFFGEWIQK